MGFGFGPPIFQMRIIRLLRGWEPFFDRWSKLKVNRTRVCKNMWVSKVVFIHVFDCGPGRMCVSR